LDRETFNHVMEILVSRYPDEVKPAHVAGGDPFKILIGAMLSHRTRDEKTDAAFQKLFTKLPTIQSIAHAKIGEIQRLIRDVGFYRQKARRLRDVSRIILREYGGRVPSDRNELMRLPGVGPKTADIVLTHGFGMAEVAVDTHVETVAKRLGLAGDKASYEEVKRAIHNLANERHLPIINRLFIAFGREICRRPRPRCHMCPVRSYCRYFQLLGG
jgi:endonuclease-3